jgi:N-acetyl-anhydromuramyl-L-alanine amidase AmpD
MDPKAIRAITIHCAATPRGRDVKAATISQWDTDKFGQISYHHVIELDGKNVQTLRYDQRGAHVAKNNTGNIGICYIGGVENNKAMTPADTRTDSQKAAMKALLLKLRATYPKAEIKGHRDWPGVTKACPSFDVKSWCRSVGIDPL